MNRLVKKDIQLSNGTTLKEGTRMIVASDFHNPVTYPDPAHFDHARFLKLREQSQQTDGNEKQDEPKKAAGWQFVTTSKEHMAFGHGQHACPGRFFASNEIKMALCYLLLKYDWKFAEGEGRSENFGFEDTRTAKAEAKVMARRREAEIDLDHATAEVAAQNERHTHS